MLHLLMTSTARAITEIGAEKQQKLFNQSYKVKIMLIVIYGLRSVQADTDTNTHTQTYRCPHKSDLRKPGMCRPLACAWFR